MLRASLKKIKSAPRLSVFVGIVGGLLIAAGMFLLLWTTMSSSPAGYRLQTADRSYSLEVVKTPEDQAKGLGGRDMLPQSSGMLFWYSSEDSRCFWMKDMRFSLDIIWADSQKRITRIERDLAPDTYPNKYCANAQYVIELNVGESAGNSLKPGDVLQF